MQYNKYLKSGDAMERVKFYSNNDMTTAYNFNKAVDISKTITDKDYEINDILDLYNILKLFNPEYLKNVQEDVKDICNESSKKINRIIGKFCSKLNNDNIEKCLNDVERNYIDDFFEGEYATSDIEYYKRSAVYELCYQPIEKVIWGNDNCIVVNLLYKADYSYINYKNILKRFLIQKAEKEDWVKDYLIQCGIIKQGEQYES